MTTDNWTERFGYNAHFAPLVTALLRGNLTAADIIEFANNLTLEPAPLLEEVRRDRNRVMQRSHSETIRRTKIAQIQGLATRLEKGTYPAHVFKQALETMSYLRQDTEAQTLGL